MDRMMEHLRRTLLWLCAALLVLSGAIGRGVVLCVSSDGGTRLEAADEAGRCREGKQGFAASNDAECSQLTLAAGSCQGCEDLTVADGSVRRASFNPASTLTLPPVVFVAAILPSYAAAETFTRVRTPRSSRPASLSSDVYAVRKTVTLLI